MYLEGATQVRLELCFVLSECNIIHVYTTIESYRARGRDTAMKLYTHSVNERMVASQLHGAELAAAATRFHRHQTQHMELVVRRFSDKESDGILEDALILMKRVGVASVLPNTLITGHGAGHCA